MKNDEMSNVFYLDDSPHRENPMTKNEVNQTTEDGWSDVKNSLQALLWEAENADNNPAFNDQTIITWIAKYGEKFDQFYQEKRAAEPEQLLDWQEQSKNGDSGDVSEFIREWVKFKNRDNVLPKENIAA